jgi:YfiH family protein
MEIVQKNGTRYLTFDSFPSSVLHAVFSRHGGLSPFPWESLNVGGTVGDDPARVRRNRYKSFGAVKRPVESIYDVWQVHSTNIVFAEKPRSPESPYKQADILFTDKPNVTLFMRFADCVPILLHDPRSGVIGLVHSGWMGTVHGAAKVAIEAMKSHYGTQPSDVLAVIGPSIGPDHYEVGSDVVVRVMQSFGESASELLKTYIDKVHFDLWSANKLLLQQAGVEQIELSGLCTACHNDDWFSHRAERGKTGRFGVLMALQ